MPKKVISKYLEYSKKNVHYGRRFELTYPHKVAYIVMDKSLEIFHEFNRNNFSESTNLFRLIRIFVRAHTIYDVFALVGDATLKISHNDIIIFMCAQRLQQAHQIYL